jgi:hypothetical protein
MEKITVARKYVLENLERDLKAMERLKFDIQTKLNGLNRQEEINMASIKDEAMAYEAPKQTKNIAELEFFSVEAEVKQETGVNKEGEEFTIKYIEEKGEKYRVPNSVLDAMQGILKKLPDTKYFTVFKSGEGWATKYTTMPHNGNITKEDVK